MRGRHILVGTIPPEENKNKMLLGASRPQICNRCLESDAPLSSEASRPKPTGICLAN